MSVLAVEKKCAVVISGLESSGKTAVFRCLTGEASGDETNFRGSTVFVKRAPALKGNAEIVDTPGLRLRSDAETTSLTLREMDQGEKWLVVIRATHAKHEFREYWKAAGARLNERKIAIAFTFADKLHAGAADELARRFKNALGVPAVSLNAREAGEAGRQLLADALDEAASPRDADLFIQSFPAEESAAANPEPLVFEKPFIGPAAAVLSMLGLFALPVYAAFLFAEFIQPLADRVVMEPLKNFLSAALQTAPFVENLLVGDYGILSLGWYSFLWAFPVVLLIALSVGVAEETGLKDRIAGALDKPMRHVGLSGRDLIPVLSGFGCNVVAVFQSRACSRCTRHACVSMIAYGSACSYQIGASLSIFNSAGQPWLFLPYLTLLAAAAAIHTRLWYGALSVSGSMPMTERAFIQKPSLRAIVWRVKSVVSQFLLQAMPIFILICAAGTVLQETRVLDYAARAAEPFLVLLNLPERAAAGVLFSIVRKDGLLVLNLGEGSLIRELSAGQLLTLVYLASTLTACLVTLWTVRKELGFRSALQIAGRQLLTSTATAFFMASGFRFLNF